MSNIMRALLLSIAATGVAALVVTKIQQPKTNQNLKEDPKGPAEIEADALSENEVTRLTDELGAML